GSGVVHGDGGGRACYRGAGQAFEGGHHGHVGGGDVWGVAAVAGGDGVGAHRAGGVADRAAGADGAGGGIRGGAAQGAAGEGGAGEVFGEADRAGGRRGRERRAVGHRRRAAAGAAHRHHGRRAADRGAGLVLEGGHHG